MLSISLAGLVGRTPSGMVGFALIVLVERESGSYGTAGAAAAIFAAGVAIGAVAYGVLVARHGMRSVLAWGGLLSGALLVLIPLAVKSLEPAGYLGFIAFGGLAFPPLASAVRSQWNRAYSDRDRRMTAATFESVVGEVAFLLGPLLVTVLLVGGSEDLPLMVAGVMMAVATLAFSRHAADESWAAPRERRGRQWLRRRGFIAALVAGLLWCVSFGIVSLTVVAAAERQHHQSLAGVLVAALSLGAIVGGLYFGAKRWSISASKRSRMILAVYGATLVPLALFAENLWLLGAVLFVAGTTSALVLAGLNVQVVAGVPQSMEMEAYGWLVAATVAGLAIGPAVGGVFVDTLGVSGSFVTAAGCAGVGAAVLALDVAPKSIRRG